MQQTLLLPGVHMDNDASFMTPMDGHAVSWRVAPGAAPDVAHSTQQLLPLFATTATPKCHRGLPFTSKVATVPTTVVVIATITVAETTATAHAELLHRCWCQQ
jgi:hypothetical protein